MSEGFPFPVLSSKFQRKSIVITNDWREGRKPLESEHRVTSPSIILEIFHISYMILLFISFYPMFCGYPIHSIKIYPIVLCRIIFPQYLPLSFFLGRPIDSFSGRSSSLSHTLSRHRSHRTIQILIVSPVTPISFHFLLSRYPLI